MDCDNDGTLISLSLDDSVASVIDTALNEVLPDDYNTVMIGLRNEVLMTQCTY